MDVQTDIRHVVKVLAGNKPDDLADLAFGIIAGHAGKSVRVNLFILCQLRDKLPERIAQAEKALARKARELFYAAGDNTEEEQALDDTMYALRALRNTSQTNHRIPHRSEAA